MMKMRTIVGAFAFGLVFAGCATSQMKSTPFYTGDSTVYKGNVEDRVNLWPLGYYRDPTLSVLWPAFSLTDDHLAVRPLYSQFRQGGADRPYDEFNFLWPLCQFDTAHGRHRVFPVIWGERYFNFFPLVWWAKDDFFNVFPVWWSNGKRDMLFPLFYRDEDMFGTPLFGWDSDSSWVLPLYYKDSDSFATLPFVSGGSGDSSYWAVPLLLSWGESSAEKSRNVFLLGLGGTAKGCGTSSQWALPLFYHSDTALMTLLYGYDRKRNGSWVFPCYYDDDDTFLSMAYWRKWSDGENGRTLSHGTFPFWYSSDRKFLSPFWMTKHDAAKGEDSWFLPPALSWGESDAAGYRRCFALGLCGYARKRMGGETDWLVPFWWRDGNGFMTLLYGQIEWAGANPGMEYVFPPLLSWSETHKDGSSAIYALLGLGAWENGKDGAFNRSWFFPLWYADKQTFLSILYQHKKVVFDPETRKKTSDCEAGSSGLLLKLLWASEYEKHNGKLVTSKKSVLWRFWHYEMKDGNVSVDSFPFFTYDAKKDGYEKTSLLWRLFRNEYDPKAGRKVDVLFVPVWR